MTLAVADLRFRYNAAGDELFAGLSHAFTPGAVTALTGKSGRGKSTLLYILGLMLSPSAGKVLIEGESAHNLSDNDRAHLRATRFGFVFQDAVLDAARPIIDSVAEPALYAGWTRRDALARAGELLDLVDVGIRATHKPGQISGGQAQRAAVARALINDPNIILADEPTGNLDHENADAILHHFQRAAHNENRTVIIATHDPHVLEFADEVVQL